MPNADSPAPVKPTIEIRVETLADLIAAIPPMLGFYPTGSLVMVATTRGQLGTVIRLDLPAPESYQEVAEYLGGWFERHEFGAANLVVVDSTGSVAALPHAGLVIAVADRLRAGGIEVKATAWAPCIDAGQPFCSYGEYGEGGFIPSPAASEMAATLAYIGSSLYRSHADLAQTLAPDPDSALRRRAERIDALHGTSSQGNLSGLELVVDAITTFDPQAAPDSEAEDDMIARVALALTDTAVRDQCIAIELTDLADRANQLWKRLIQAAPVTYRVTPANLFAAGMYLCGEGVLAQIALKIARESDPGNPLARLLQEVINHGISPTEFRALLGRVAERA